MKRKRAIFLGVLIVLMIIVSIGNLLYIKSQREKWEAEQQENQNQIQEQNEEQQPEDSEEVEEQQPEEELEEAPEEVVVLDETKAVPVWTVSGVNMREEPNTDCEILKVLDGNVELKKYEEEDGWALVKCEELVGYVSMNYLTETDPAKQVVEETTEEAEKPSTPKVEVIPGQHRDPNNIVVVVDPGHQSKGSKEKEPNGPGSDNMKARNTWGATGNTTGVPEYILNLDVGLKLQKELENRGYVVYMTRSSHDVQISNMERALYAADVGADITVSIHADSIDDKAVRGAKVVVPSHDNLYVSHLANASQNLGECIIDAYCEATGFKNRGAYVTDTMTGINWSQNPVAYLELGFMSNPEEDQAMQDEAMQNNMVQGIANGIDAYFGF